ncbi:MAG: restriction endonuclease [Candidatus Promineifilaceae bacterium]
MNSQQYEELCRFVIADRLKIDINQIRSATLSSPVFPGLQAYDHQIDLYWETDNELVQYLNIANAKWRRTTKVEQGEVLLLQQVKEEVQAHKAMMITSTEFTAGAKSVAEAKGIALLIVRPNFDYKGFPIQDRVAMQTRFQHQQQLTTHDAKPMYTYEIVYRALDFPLSSPVTSPRQDGKPSYSNKMITGQGISQKVVNGQQTRITAQDQTVQRIVPNTKGQSSPIQSGTSPMIKGGHSGKSVGSPKK